MPTLIASVARSSAARSTRHRTGPLLMACDIVTIAAVTALLHPDSTPVTGAIVVTASLAYLHAAGLFRSRLTLSVLDDLPSLGIAVVVGTTATAILSTQPLFGRPAGLYVLGLLGALALMRAAAYAVVRAVRSRGTVRHRTLVYGAGDLAITLSTVLGEHPELGLEVVGLVDNEPPRKPTPVPWLGGRHELCRLMEELEAGELLVAVDSDRAAEVSEILRVCERLRCHLFLVPSADYVVPPTSRRLDEAWGIPLLRYTPGQAAISGRLAKRCFDIVVSGMALLISLPVLLAVALAVRVEGGPGVFFRQERVGLDGSRFTLVKFRSMRPTAPGEADTTWTITGDPRIGPVGRFIRRTSLDELPQLWNVLVGQMSLVGPRPERPHFVEAFTESIPIYGARHRMPVGLTGWAQVHGLRGDTSVVERAIFDHNYIQGWSMWMDVKILVRTVSHVVGASCARPRHRPSPPVAVDSQDAVS
ncbi:sugar transferase [Nocardioides donggukensis]|uniref:Sugar transferase n=1 Tax=Nocardioides donggukensis TaxID=2774019 RepID=A0A927K3K0_9ACTN|nr:sugar transferase [Nocardioides donggukensis]MBD8869494.1 sugar transferase [Nocardioides donggukensis]